MRAGGEVDGLVACVWIYAEWTEGDQERAKSWEGGKIWVKVGEALGIACMASMFLKTWICARLTISTLTMDDRASLAYLPSDFFGYAAHV
jgi:hypothetical protein